MDPLALLTMGRPRDALQLALTLLDDHQTAPRRRRRAWRLVVDLAAANVNHEAQERHKGECSGCAWCSLGMPDGAWWQPSLNDQTTSSLRSEG